MTRVFILVALFLTPLAIQAESVRYQRLSDEFGAVHAVDALAENTQAQLSLRCFPSGELDLQLITQDVIDPDDSDLERMRVRVSYTFDDQTVHTDLWIMRLFRYYNAWYVGNVADFVAQAYHAKRLAIRLNKMGQIYRFNLDGAAKHFENMTRGCVREAQAG